MSNPASTKLYFYKGDHRSLLFIVKDSNGDPVDLSTYDKWQFRVFEKGKESTPEIDVDTDGDLTISDTNKLTADIPYHAEGREHRFKQILTTKEFNYNADKLK